jgi:hypothetical protein
MTSKTKQGRSSAAEDAAERARALLRADELAVLDDDLDDDMPAEDVGPSDHTTTSSRVRSQVYSIRVPVERLEQVRRLARERGEAPTAMLRDWVLMCLDAATAASADAEATFDALKRQPETHPGSKTDNAAERLEAAAAVLVENTQQLSSLLVTCMEALAIRDRVGMHPAAQLHENAAHTAGPGPGMYAIAIEHASDVHWTGHPQRGRWVTQQKLVMPLVSNHIENGLTALWSTMESAANWPGIGDHELGSLYAAADEELSNT